MSRRPGQLLNIFRQELLANLLWKLFNVLGMQGSVLLSTVIVARLLGLQDFGAYAVIVTTVMAVAGVSQAGTSLTATKFVGEYLVKDKAQVSRVLRMCLLTTLAIAGLTAALLALAAPAIAADVLGKPHLELYVRWAGAAAACQTVAVFQNGALEGFGAFRQLSRLSVTAGLVHLLATALGAWLWGLDGAVAGFGLAMLARLVLFSALLSSVRAEHGIPGKAEVTASDWRELLAFTLPAGLASLVTLPCLWLVTALVARQPGGLELTGLFMAANQIRMVVVQLPIMLNAVAFSVLSRKKGQGLAREFQQVFWSNLFATAVVSTLVVAVLCIFAAPILGLYGSKFVQGQALLLVLLCAVIPETLALAAYQLVQSSGRMWASLLLIVGPRDLAYLGLSALLMPALGITGVGVAYLSVQVFSLISTILVGGRTAPIRAGR